MKWKEGTRVWKKEDAKARAALGKATPNPIWMEILESKMFYKMWEAVQGRIKRITLHQKLNLKGRVRADLGGHLKYSQRWSGVCAGVLLEAQGAVRRGENRGGL